MPPKDEAPADDTIDDPPPWDDMMPVLRALVAPAPEVPPAVFMTVDALYAEAPAAEAHHAPVRELLRRAVVLHHVVPDADLWQEGKKGSKAKATMRPCDRRAEGKGAAFSGSFVGRAIMRYPLSVNHSTVL